MTPHTPIKPDSPPCQCELSLRDTIAIAAVQGLIANGKIPINKIEVADVAYEYADAMLKARDRQRTQYDIRVLCSCGEYFVPVCPRCCPSVP